MTGIALPQQWIAPVVAGYVAAALRRTAGAVELIVGRAVAHGVVDSDLIARPDHLHRDDGDLPVKACIRLASMVDVVRGLVGRKRDEIEALLDLHGVTADLLGEVVQLLGRNEAPAPHSNDAAGLDQLPGKYGLATGHVTISDFAL